MPALRGRRRAEFSHALFALLLLMVGAWGQHAQAQAAPAMSVTKVLSFNSDNDSSGNVTQGDVLHYTVTATNTAGVPLTNVKVSDPLLTPTSNTCASVLAKGNKCQLVGTYTVTAADVSNGVITNTGSATSNEITTPVNSNTVNTIVFGSPAMSVKVVLASFTDNDNSGNVTPGDQLFYNVTATNTGNVQLTNVQVTDGGAPPSNCSPVAVNGTCVLSTSYIVQAADAVVGFVKNTGSATSTEVPGPVTNTLSTPVLPSAALSLVSGNNQVGVVGEHSTHPLVVHLVDSNGQPFAGKSIGWQVVSGPAVLDGGSSNTDSSGNAQIGFTYGPTTTGAIVMRATFGTSTVDFNATSQSYLITILGGNGQTAGPGQSLPQDFVVQVALPAGITALRPANGAQTHALPTLAGVAVQWQVISGGGSLSLGASTVTDANGRGTNHYTLGPAAGLNQVRVIVPGGASVTFSSTSVNNTALQIVSGNAQTLTTNTPSAPLVVLLTNNGVPVANATIAWSATNATLATATSVTDSTGHASNIAKVTNPGAATVTASSSAPPAGPTTFGLNGGIENLGGLTPQQGQIAHAIDNACPALEARTNLTPAEQDLLAQCQALAFSAGQDPDQARNALTQMFSDVAFLQTSAALLISNAQFDNIKARIAALRSGTGGAHFGGLAFNTPDGSLPMGSVGDTLLGFADAQKDDKKQEVGSGFDRWGFFASGTFGHGTSDPRQVTPGFGFNTNGLTAGVDYRYSDKLIFGVSAGYAKYNANLTVGAGGMDTTGWSLSAYSTFFRQDSWYLDGVLTFGSNNYDINRTIIYTLTTNTGTMSVNQMASASAGGSTFAGALTFGRDFSKGPWSFGPYFRGTYTLLNFDNYQETLQAGAPGNGLGLAIQARDLKSTASVLGAKVNYVSSQSWGVVMPHAEVEWEHEFQDSPDSIVAHFIHDPTATPIQVTADSIDTDFFRLGLGLSFVFTHGRSGFIYYEKTLGRTGITQDNIALGLRLEF
jgi:uncharacterized repeat protein (TIGR01451 family)